MSSRTASYINKKMGSGRRYVRNDSGKTYRVTNQLNPHILPSRRGTTLTPPLGVHPYKMGKTTMISRLAMPTLRCSAVAVLRNVLFLGALTCCVLLLVPPIPDDSNHATFLSRKSSFIFTKSKQRRLSHRLNFGNLTALNFLHFHKTGGVALKTALHLTYAPCVKRTWHSQPIKVLDSCYRRRNARSTAPSFEQWRCDWRRLSQMSYTQRMSHDFIFGHQFLGGEHNAAQLLYPRDVRTWTILRHPLTRKMSFYFHFFARARGRAELDVTHDELVQFLIRETVPVGTEVGSDAGPNYVTGRLLSDGYGDGFVHENDKSRNHSWYAPRNALQGESQRTLLARALKIVDGLLFIGLHEEGEATKCMLHRVVALLDDALDIVPPAAPRLLKRLGHIRNEGKYDINANALWTNMTIIQRAQFNQHEWVDLQIYEYARKRFEKQAVQFGCAHLLNNKVVLSK